MLNLSLNKEAKGAKLLEMKVPFASENYTNRASRQLFPEWLAILSGMLDPPIQGRTKVTHAVSSPSAARKRPGTERE